MRIISFMLSNLTFDREGDLNEIWSLGLTGICTDLDGHHYWLKAFGLLQNVSKD